jgi:hypothetical protein
VSSARQPLGPPQIDFRPLNDEDFENLCFLLILLEYPKAERIQAPDGGADAVLAAAEAGAYERCWQMKRFTGRVYWEQCEKSLDRGRRNYHPAQYTFMFAKDLTLPQRKAFAARVEGRHSDTLVDYVGSSALVAKLLSTAEGERIANHFYADANVNGAALMAAMRAVAARGALETADDVTERLRAISEFLESYDPYFQYSPSARPASSAPPTFPGSVLARETVTGQTIERLDVTPRNSEVMEQFAPSLRIMFENTREGRAAAAQFEAVLLHGGEVALTEGAWVEFTQLPKLFQDDVGVPLRGARITVTPNWEPVPARLVILNPDGSHVRDIDLVRRPPPKGWEASIGATPQGFDLQVSLRRRKKRGQALLTWRLSSEGASNRERLLVLEMTVALHRPGTLRLERRDDALELFSQPLEKRQVPDWISGLREVLSAVVAIEDWVGTQLQLPEELTRDDLIALAEVSYIVQNQRSRMGFASVELDVPPDVFDFTADEYHLRIEQEAKVELFQQTFDLGYFVGQLRARVASRGTPDSAGKVPIRLEPARPEDGNPTFALTRTIERPIER